MMAVFFFGCDTKQDEGTKPIQGYKERAVTGPGALSSYLDPATLGATTGVQLEMGRKPGLNKVLTQRLREGPTIRDQFLKELYSNLNLARIINSFGLNLIFFF